jgi:hypothetical protein
MGPHTAMGNFGKLSYFMGDANPLFPFFVFPILKMARCFFPSIFDWKKIKDTSVHNFIKHFKAKAINKGTYSFDYLNEKLANNVHQKMEFVSGMYFPCLRVMSLNTIIFSVSQTDLLKDTKTKKNKREEEYFHLTDKEIREYKRGRPLYIDPPDWAPANVNAIVCPRLYVKSATMFPPAAP